MPFHAKGNSRGFIPQYDFVRVIQQFGRKAYSVERNRRDARRDQRQGQSKASACVRVGREGIKAHGIKSEQLVIFCW